jgi:hypothetical protein
LEAHWIEKSPHKAGPKIKFLKEEILMEQSISPTLRYSTFNASVIREFLIDLLQCSL